VDLIVDAFTRIGKPLVVIGEGSDLGKARLTAGPNVKLLGYQPDNVVADHLQRAKAFVNAADEDFGIVSVEAQAAGCPVIAYSKGGNLETVVGWPAPDATGMFFDSQTPQALEEVIKLFETHQGEFRAEACRRNAERFGQQRFQKEFSDALEELWSRFRRRDELQ
jgi:glycosyltransferase involved in cell wall biosynthesis